MDETERYAHHLGELLQAEAWRITTAESCTGGLVAAALTEISGSSLWFEQGAVTYSNAAKESMLSVPDSVLKQHGAVSEACVLAMAKGALRCSEANLAVSVSGIAGPGGGSSAKPVGTVWLAWATADSADAAHFLFAGNRAEVRKQAVLEALRGSIHRIERLRQL